MNDKLTISKNQQSLTLTQRVGAALVAKQLRTERCLLLDVSGSMAEDAGDGKKKIAALRQIVLDFPHERKFCFSSDCEETDQIPSPSGGTNLALAFCILKRASIRHAVLITDGLPDSEQAALEQVKDGRLKLDIFYVGPPPAPSFLTELATLTGGQFQSSTLKTSEQPRLTQAITALLEHQ